MAWCTYCRRRFCSEQAVKAHLKHCTRYHADKNQKSAALGKQPKAAATPAATSTPPASIAGGSPDLAVPWGELKESMDEFSRKLNEPPSTQQRRRAILQATKAQVIDSYRTSVGQVTMAMRGAAKIAIERELATSPLEELPLEEVLELSTAIRDRIYAPEFRTQEQEAEQHRVEQKAQQRKELEALGTLIRAARRKNLFISQATSQALRYCEEKGVVGLECLTSLGDIKSRLTEFLTGDEAIPEAQVIVQGVLDAKFAELDAMLAAARAKADEKWREKVAGLFLLGGVLVLPILAAAYPTQTAQVFAWLERIFGWPATAEPTTHVSPKPAASPPSDPSPRTRRRTVKVSTPCPESSTWRHPAEETAQAES